MFSALCAFPGVCRSCMPVMKGISLELGGVLFLYALLCVAFVCVVLPHRPMPSGVR